MMKRIKLSICFILTLALMFTFTCASAFASNTKSATITSTKTFTCTQAEISGNMQIIQNSTYNYDDGSFSGILNFSQIISVNVVPAGKNSNNLDVYQVTVTFTYYGTVNRYNPVPTKSIYVTVNKTFTCAESQVAANMTAIQNSTYDYNDGSYSGTLNYAKISDTKVTVVGYNSSGSILQFNVKVDYSGTVTYYK